MATQPVLRLSGASHTYANYKFGMMHFSVIVEQSFPFSRLQSWIISTYLQLMAVAEWWKSPRMCCGLHTLIWDYGLLGAFIILNQLPVHQNVQVAVAHLDWQMYPHGPEMGSSSPSSLSFDEQDCPVAAATPTGISVILLLTVVLGFSACYFILTYSSPLSHIPTYSGCIWGRVCIYRNPERQ